MSTEAVGTEIIKLAINQGIWAVLFVALLFYVLRNGETRENRLVAERKQSEEKAAQREEKLFQHIDGLSNLCTDVAEVKKDVSEVKSDIKFLKGKMSV